MKRTILFSLLAVNCILLSAQPWQADLGNGHYRNPVLMVDYSDPDVCRVGDDYYMTSSSFNCVPGLQLLHSRDLLNWKVVGAALPDRVPYLEGGKQLGKGVWAPSIRFHNGMFYIFYGDPDKGIIRLTSTSVEGPWEEKLVMPASGYIDPCPLWDEDGRVWLVHALAGSRAGLKSVLLMAELDSTASRVITPSRIIFDGHLTQPTCEGPKLYKRNGWYYIFTPAGGVRTGWQTVLRSRKVYGPYEEKIVLEQGKTGINGPHQGAWVTTGTGEDWFIHFQDRGAYGRVVHMQPMKWVEDWPVMGKQGEPVSEYRRPVINNTAADNTDDYIDDFDSVALGLDWQWMAAPDSKWYYCNSGESLLRLFSVSYVWTGERHDEWSLHEWLQNAPNLLMQKFPAENFTVTARVRLNPGKDIMGEVGGIVISGEKYHYLALRNEVDRICIVANGRKESGSLKPGEWVWLQARITMQDKNTAQCGFYYSSDGKKWNKAVDKLSVRQEKNSWIGCKAGLFCLRPLKPGKGPGFQTYNDGGSLDVDFWHVK
ncbi:MAG: glycoside hydrolase 43 family protein [Paludibacteraceae bacterium]|nr:glycoside hydrolase 43 family protein [Paludibacteraceae bacterium]